MSVSQLKPVHILSAIIVVLALAASLGGVLIPDLYRDNALVTAGWYGNDLVTLVVAVPLLAGALVLSLRGSRRARLVLLGMLDYTLYNFAFYLFGAAFNRFFLIYVALFALSIYALIAGLATLDVQAISRQFRAGTPVKWISGYMLLVALMLGGLWIGQSAGFVFTGQLPAIVVTVNHPTNVIAALDLTLVVSVLFLGAIWLWQRKPWGFVLATIANVKGAIYTLVLAASSASAALSGIEGVIEQIPLWGFLFITSLIVSIILLVNMQSTPTSNTQEILTHG